MPSRKKSLVSLMPPPIQRFHANGQFHRTGTYGGSALAKIICQNRHCYCYYPGYRICCYSSTKCQPCYTPIGKI